MENSTVQDTEYQIGDRVVVTGASSSDTYTGTITKLETGPYPTTAAYYVRLDDQMGEGWWPTGQVLSRTAGTYTITPQPQPKTKTAGVYYDLLAKAFAQGVEDSDHSGEMPQGWDWRTPQAAAVFARICSTVLVRPQDLDESVLRAAIGEYEYGYTAGWRGGTFAIESAADGIAATDGIEWGESGSRGGDPTYSALAPDGCTLEAENSGSWLLGWTWRVLDREGNDLAVGGAKDAGDAKTKAEQAWSGERVTLGTIDHEADEPHLASEDYPVLDSILHERLPMTIAKRAAKTAAVDKATRRTAWNIAQVRNVLTEGAQKIDGMLMDAYTASMLTQVYDALSPEQQALLDSKPLDVVVTVGWKLARPHAAHLAPSATQRRMGAAPFGYDGPDAASSGAPDGGRGYYVVYPNGGVVSGPYDDPQDASAESANTEGTIVIQGPLPPADSLDAPSVDDGMALESYPGLGLDATSGLRAQAIYNMDDTWSGRIIKKLFGDEPAPAIAGSPVWQGATPQLGTCGYLVDQQCRYPRVGTHGWTVDNRGPCLHISDTEDCPYSCPRQGSMPGPMVPAAGPIPQGPIPVWVSRRGQKYLPSPHTPQGPTLGA